jgi:eukaryotic-like serine/threonine-protein kinase
VARVSDTLINTLFDGRYRILRKLGSGGMANVYLAEDEELGRRVAIKILNDRYANDELFIERFRREAKSAASLSHPNIVSIYDRGEAEGTYYIAMEVIEGRSLKELILTRGALPIPQAVAYAKQLLEALRFAHRHGIIHRDIKPHNVLVSTDERAKRHETRLKVTDFGIARDAASQMTEAGSIMGTAQYLSPEQARGAPVTAASDLYSAGVVLYEMLTGKVPFNGESAIEIAMKHVNDIPKPPSHLRPEVPPDLDKVVLRALAKEPEDRFETADEFIEDLERVEEGLPVSRDTSDAATALLATVPLGVGATEVLPTQPAPPSARPRPQAPRRPPPYPPEYRYDERPPRRRRLFPWLLVLLLLVAAGVAGWWVYNQIQEQIAAKEPVAVPNVVGIEKALAVAKIEDAGLDPDVQEQPNREVKPGIVFDQNPNPGNRIQKGDVVTIFVSTGPKKVEVPALVGKQFDEAIQILDDAGLEWRKVEVFSRKPVGQVVRQDPKAGEEANEGSTVLLRVSKGVEQASVPNVLQQPEESAAAELSSAGFEVEVVRAASNDTPEGIVFAQNPDPDVEAPRGSTVQITVSSGPSQADVPDVIGEDETTAKETLRDAGFKVRVERTDTSDPTQDGLVVEQDPPGETQADEGSTVTIVVARFSG